ncbi:MAG: heavy metal-associated domain-containing protein [Candidatus Anstonellales archaeon]
MKAEIKISRMCCKSRSALIRGVIADIPGLKSVNVSIGKVIIEYEGNETISRVKKAIL